MCCRLIQELMLLEKIVDDPSIEILITDINMPGLSGTELAQRARSFRDQLHVILLSGREINSHGYPLIASQS